MNMSSVTNSSDDFFSNDTEVETKFYMFSVIYSISILMNFPLNSYVIWLIVTGTGNGLAAEFFIVTLSIYEILKCIETIVPYLIVLYNCYIPDFVPAFFDGFDVGRPLFQCLICVERYLAVVHPVTFLKYKPLRYRLMCSAVAWGTIFVCGGFNSICWLFAQNAYMFFSALPFIFISIQLFCCLAVLRALKQSGPGERGREREEENNMKRRAFYLILINTVSMIIIYTPYSILFAVCTPQNESSSLTLVGFVWVSLAGLVQPVLFLYRVRKLKFVKCQ